MMIKLSRRIAIFFLGAFCPLSFSVEPMTPYQNAFTAGPNIESRSGAFAIVGDTQRTLLVEQVFLGREVNTQETTQLLAVLAGEPIDFLVHLGDLVGNGGSRNAWDTFDRQMDPIVRAGVSVLPILGNHEYMFGGQKNLVHLRDRFTSMRASSRFVKLYQGVLLIGLNTNRDKMSDAEWDDQTTWFRDTVQAADQNPDIRGIVAFGHHPPYTNSTCVKDDLNVQADLVPTITGSRKFLALFSGHAHGYERFHEGGKEFIISAGGGGPRGDVRTGRKQRHPDLFHGTTVRPFNYLVVSIGDAGIEITVKGFQKGEANVAVVERFTLPFTDTASDAVESNRGLAGDPSAP